MSNRIKGITVQISGDTTGLNKALEGTEKKIGSTQKQLKDVERLLKLDPTNTTLLEQKQRLLATAVGETREKLDALNDANEQVAKSAEIYGAWKKAYDPIQEEITTTQKKLADLRNQQQEMKDVGEVDTDAYREIVEQAEAAAKELRELKNQAKAVSEEFGNPVSPEQYDSLQREIAATEISLRDLAKKANDVDKALDGIDSQEVDELGDSLEDAANDASNLGDMLKAGAIIEGAKGIVSSLKDVSEETKEHRKIMASLEVSSEKAGYTAEQTQQAYEELYGVLADDQSAATTLANLQALGLSQEKLHALIQGTIGSWATYGDSIPIDSLAESINETVKAGRVTGTFADILNWGAKEGETYGVAMREATEENEAWNASVEDAESAEDFFNLALQQCSTEAERANLIMNALAEQGLTDASEKWQENNASMVESNKVSAEMQEQMAVLGEKIEPVVTRLTSLVVQALEWFNSLDEGTQMTILGTIAIVAALGPVSTAFSGVTSSIGNVIQILPKMQTMFSSVIGFIASNPIVLLIAAIVGLVALIATKGDEIQAVLQKVDDFLQGIFTRDWTEVFGPVLGGILNDFFANVKAIWDSIKTIFDGIIDFIRGVFTGDWERAWNGVVSIFDGIFSGLVSLAKTPLNAIISLVNRAIDGINAGIQAVNKLPGVNIGTLGHLPMLATGGEVIRGSAVVGDGGPELLTVANGRTVVQPLTNNTTNHNTSLGGVNITVYGAPGQNVRELAEIVMDEIQSEYGRKEAAL